VHGRGGWDDLHADDVFANAFKDKLIYRTYDLSLVEMSLEV
jgi:hypothetical protein